MAANEESDPSAILNGFWVTLFFAERGALELILSQNIIKLQTTDNQV